MIVNIERPNVIVDVGNNVVIGIEQTSLSLNIVTGGLVPIGDDVSLTAGANLSALRAVTTDANGDAVYASNDTLENALVVGIAANAANTGQVVTIKTSGIMTDASWTWTKGLVFLGTNGQLTQTPPTAGAILVYVGRALTSTKLQIDIDTIIRTI